MQKNHSDTFFIVVSILGHIFINWHIEVRKQIRQSDKIEWQTVERERKREKKMAASIVAFDLGVRYENRNRVGCSKTTESGNRQQKNCQLLFGYEDLI